MLRGIRKLKGWLSGVIIPPASPLLVRRFLSLLVGSPDGVSDEWVGIVKLPFESGECVAAADPAQGPCRRCADDLILLRIVEPRGQRADGFRQATSAKHERRHCGEAPLAWNATGRSP